MTALRDKTDPSETLIPLPALFTTVCDKDGVAESACGAMAVVGVEAELVFATAD